jgi:dienelactone hydrolase
MIRGIDAWLTNATRAAKESHTKTWRPDLNSAAAFETWMKIKRERLARIIGAVDQREPVNASEYLSTTAASSLIARGDGYVVHQVRWPVLPGVQAEGLLLEPEHVMANVVALPDADWMPEQLAGIADGLPENAQFARRLAENGCRVLVPVLIDRSDTFSCNPQLGRFTNQPHREFINRAAFEMGRHVIGYEVQKVLAAVDWFAGGTGILPVQPATSGPAGSQPHGLEDHATAHGLEGRARLERLPIGVMGYGEGGLIAFYSAAIDARIDAVVVSGYFRPRDQLWAEPIYRNVWTLLRDFGDAEILTLIAPRTAIIEASREPQVSGPPPAHDNRKGAAPGKLETAPIEAIREEFERALHLLNLPDLSGRFELAEADQGGPAPIACTQTMAEFLHALSIHQPMKSSEPP